MDKVKAFMNSKAGKVISHSLAAGAMLLLTAIASAFADNATVHTVLVAICPK